MDIDDMVIIKYGTEEENTKLYIDYAMICILITIFLQWCSLCRYRNYNAIENNINDHTININNNNNYDHNGIAIKKEDDYYKRYQDKLETMAKNKWISNQRLWEDEYAEDIRKGVIEYKDKLRNELDQLKGQRSILEEKIRLNTLTLQDGRGDDEEDYESSESDDDDEESIPFEQQMAEHKQNVQEKIHAYDGKIKTLQQKLRSHAFIKRIVIEKRMSMYIRDKLVALTNHHVIDNTPVGNVIMTYSYADNAFKYYCDKSVQHKILLVVCRKYVCTYHCVPLYLDNELNIRFIFEGKINRFQFLKD